jgi:Mrp family chromosome partitioning ATPase
MSNNFELLKQIERESSVSDGCILDDVSRSASAKQRFVPQVTLDIGQEEIMRLVQRVFLSANERAPRLVVFCGVDGESGSSSICARAGLALATEYSHLVCLVDANLRSPRLSNIFGVDAKTPCSDESAFMREQCTQIEGNLWFAGADLLTDAHGALPAVNELKQRLTKLRGMFEYVLIDAPGTSVCENAAHLGQAADAAILVIEANSTRRLTARNAKASLDAAGVRLLGTVLNNRTFAIPEQLYRKL